ncbi:MAG: PIN domain-containing protein [Nitrospirae bacterium]|nr:PIN domain-containing protein [Nitrospirota bacterium]
MGRDIFVDTGAFIAMRAKDDANYGKAQGFLNTIRDKRLKLHTTNFILDEVYTYFCKSHEVAVDMAELIMNNPLIILHRISAEDEKRAWEILKQYRDKTFSYTDACSFALMERLKIDTAFTFDEHFNMMKFRSLPL